MRLRTVMLIVVTLLVGQTGWSQTKSLGDVAGTIKLNPEAIVEKTGVVEDPKAAIRADRISSAACWPIARRRLTFSVDS